MTDKSISLAGEPSGKPFQNQLNPRQRILVVDDDGDIRRLNTEVLVGAGYEVDSAANGALAWDILQFKRYDLLVTDYNMPKMSGVELLLKLHACRMALPVILVSGTIPWEKLKRHPWLHIDATLLKPHTPDELLAEVEKVLFITVAISEKCVQLINKKDPQPKRVNES
jgi:DNA-binding response OmpR family regulator